MSGLFLRLTTPTLFLLLMRPQMCAGSGASVFKGVKADLFLTGELSHHVTSFVDGTPSFLRLVFEYAASCLLVKQA
jgi:hypothetical protein